MDPQSPDFGQRTPFTLRIRNDASPDGTSDHTGVLFPAVQYQAGRRYAFVVTRRVHAVGDPSRPFTASSFFEQVAAAPSPGVPTRVTRARESIGAVLDFLARDVEVPIPREDVALALSFSIRSERFDPSMQISRFNLTHR